MIFHLPKEENKCLRGIRLAVWLALASNRLNKARMVISPTK
jgi:hypothetical protein